MSSIQQVWTDCFAAQKRTPSRMQWDAVDRMPIEGMPVLN